MVSLERKENNLRWIGELRQWGGGVGGAVKSGGSGRRSSLT